MSEPLPLQDLLDYSRYFGVVAFSQILPVFRIPLIWLRVPPCGLMCLTYPELLHDALENIYSDGGPIFLGLEK